jgi:hypothetical protein
MSGEVFGGELLIFVVNYTFCSFRFGGIGTKVGSHVERIPKCRVRRYAKFSTKISTQLDNSLESLAFLEAVAMLGTFFLGTDFDILYYNPVTLSWYIWLRSEGTFEPRYEASAILRAEFQCLRAYKK